MKERESITKGGVFLYRVPLPGQEPLLIHPESRDEIILGERGSGRRLITIPIKAGRGEMVELFREDDHFFFVPTSEPSPEGGCLLIARTLGETVYQKGWEVQRLARGEVIVKGKHAYGKGGKLGWGEEPLILCRPGCSFVLNTLYSSIMYQYRQGTWIVLPEDVGEIKELKSGVPSVPQSLPRDHLPVFLASLSYHHTIPYFGVSYNKRFILPPFPGIRGVYTGVWDCDPEGQFIYSAILTQRCPFIRLVPLYKHVTTNHYLILIQMDERLKINFGREAKIIGDVRGKDILFVLSSRRWWERVSREIEAARRGRAEVIEVE